MATPIGVEVLLRAALVFHAHVPRRHVRRWALARTLAQPGPHPHGHDPVVDRRLQRRGVQWLGLHVAAGGQERGGSGAMGRAGGIAAAVGLAQCALRFTRPPATDGSPGTGSAELINRWRA